jgi:hypothetical protein
MKAGSNTSTVTVRVVGSDEKGSLKSEAVKYGRESQGTGTRERLLWQRPAAYTKDRPGLSSEKAPHKKQDSNCQTVINIWSWAPVGLDNKIYWLTVCRNVTLTLTYGRVLRRQIEGRRLVWDGRQPVKTRTRKQGNVYWWRHSRLRRISTCCSELQSVWISNSAIFTCSYGL